MAIHMQLIQKNQLPRFVGYGVLLFVITNALLFILSIITRSDQPMAVWWVWPIIAVLLAICTFWFRGAFPPSSTSGSLVYGLAWALLLIVFLLIVTIPNKTTAIVFGSWSAYLVFIGVAAGPVLRRRKKSVTAAL